MARFVRNAKTVSKILKRDPGIAAARRRIAEQIAEDAKANGAKFVVVAEYETDRGASAVTVDAHSQDKHGVLTKAAPDRTVLN